jgi:hypothetical protein
MKKVISPLSLLLFKLYFKSEGCGYKLVKVKGLKTFLVDDRWGHRSIVSFDWSDFFNWLLGRRPHMYDVRTDV